MQVVNLTGLAVVFFDDAEFMELSHPSIHMAHWKGDRNNSQTAHTLPRAPDSSYDRRCQYLCSHPPESDYTHKHLDRVVCILFYFFLLGYVREPVCSNNRTFSAPSKRGPLWNKGGTPLSLDELPRAFALPYREARSSRPTIGGGVTFGVTLLGVATETSCPRLTLLCFLYLMLPIVRGTVCVFSWTINTVELSTPKHRVPCSKKEVPNPYRTTRRPSKERSMSPFHYSTGSNRPYYLIG